MSFKKIVKNNFTLSVFVRKIIKTEVKKNESPKVHSRELLRGQSCHLYLYAEETGLRVLNVMPISTFTPKSTTVDSPDISTFL